MLQHGTKTFKVTPPVRAVVQSDGAFTLFGHSSRKRQVVLGPFKASDRFCVVDVRGEYDNLEVRAKPACLWTLDWHPLANGEPVDDRPVELPVDYVKPATLQEQIQSWIRTELSSQSVEDGGDSEDEADDFDVSDEDNIEFVSAHECLELQPDYVPEEEPEATEDPPVEEEVVEDPPAEEPPEAEAAT